MIGFPLPLIGFSAYSGTGKTTLLTQLLPLLRADGLRIGVVKHAHHQFDIDHPGKDSYQLRHAGASQMLIASAKRVAWIREREADEEEPQLAEALAGLQTDSLDLVLVEGFKQEAFPKIELHRPALGKPRLYPDDGNIIAIASDVRLPELPAGLPWLDLNDVPGIARFVRQTLFPDTRFPDTHGKARPA